ncbi:YkyA family protein [Paenisporosarcina sp. TG-14]|uniref:YkyA family protein n=1 Tax=Paenisporosarcina sp. TG-14 TaxID=1231057 RepID=UPI0002D93097|nr:YkyA family protein [Paenisporosarcina sp. TG-14]
MKKIVIGTFLSTSIILSACSIGVTTEEKLSETLATIYEEEQGYRDAQQQLTVLEKKEQSTFNSSMELTQEQQEEVSIKVEELKSSLMERLTLLNEENESIESALASLSSFDSLIDDVKEEEIKTSLIDLKSLIETRYQAHDVVSKEYQKLTDLQTVLYDMLVDEEMEQAQLQEQVLKVNEQNDIVQSSINEFNEETIELNELKVSIYDSLDEK